MPDLMESLMSGLDSMGKVWATIAMLGFIGHTSCYDFDVMSVLAG